MSVKFELKTACSLSFESTKSLNASGDNYQAEQQVKYYNSPVGGDVAITDGSKLYIVTRENSKGEVVDLSCNCQVACWSPDGNFVIAYDVEQQLKLVSRDQLRVVYSNHTPFSGLIDGSIKKICCVPMLDTQGLYSIVVSSKKSALVIENVQLDCFLPNNESKKVKGVLPTMTPFDVDEEANDLIAISSVSTACVVANNSNFPLQMYVKNELSSMLSGKIEYQKECCISKETLHTVTGCSMMLGFKKVFHAFSSVFAVDDIGRLYQFSLNGLLLENWWPQYQFEDLNVIVHSQIQDKVKSKCSKLFGILNNELSTESKTLKVFTLPEFKEVFSDRCDVNAQLIGGNFLDGNCWFIQTNRHQDQIKDDESSPTKRMKFSQYLMDLNRIVEISPESRLKRLISIGLFDEAERLAEEFGLDKKVMFRHKFAYEVELLEDETDPQNIKKLLDEISKDMDKLLDDPIYVCESLLELNLQPNVDSDGGLSHLIITSCHQYLNKCSTNCHQLSDQEKKIVQRYICKVTQQMVLLATFQLEFTSIGDLTIEWPLFKSYPLPQIVAMFLMKGCLKKVVILFERHAAEMMEHLKKDVSRFKQMMDKVPRGTEMSEICVWLQCIIPLVLKSNVQHAIQIVSNWVYERSTSLEETDNVNWPNNGHKLSSMFFTIVHNLSNNGFLGEHMSGTLLVLKCNIPAVSKLRALVTKLERLMVLHSSYQCKVSLKELTMETCESLTYRMLDKCAAPESIPTYLQTTIKPYVRENKLDLDHIISTYVQNFLLNKIKKVYEAFPTLTERKASVLVSSISCNMRKAKVSLMLAKKAAIPWSSQVKNVVDEVLKFFSDKNSQAFKLESEQKEMKRLERNLKKSISLARVPSIAAKHVKHRSSCCVFRTTQANQKLVRYLATKDDHEAFNDAIEIASTYSEQPKKTVYCHRIDHLLNQNKVDAAMKIVRKISTKQLIVSLVGVYQLRTSLILEHTQKSMSEKRVTASKFVCSLIREAKRRFSSIDKNTVMEWEQFSQVINNLLVLHTEHDQLLNIKLYTDKSADISNESLQDKLERCKEDEDLSETMNSINKTIHQYSESNTPSNGKFLSLANKMNIGGDKTHMAICRYLVSVEGKEKVAIQMSRDLLTLSPSEEIADEVAKICLLLLTRLQNHYKTIAVLLPDILSLLGIVLKNCSIKLVVGGISAVTLHSICFVFYEIYKITNYSSRALLTQYIAEAASSERDHLTHGEWLHNNWFIDGDGLNAEFDQIMPSLGKLFNCLYINNESIGATAWFESVQSCQQHLGSLQKVLQSILNKLIQIDRIQCCIRLQAIVQSILVNNLLNSIQLYKIKNNDQSTALIYQQFLSQVIKQFSFESQQLAEKQLERTLVGSYCDPLYSIALFKLLSNEKCFEILDGVYSQIREDAIKLQNLSYIGFIKSCQSLSNTNEDKYRCLYFDSRWVNLLEKWKIASAGEIFRTNHFRKEKLQVALLTSKKSTAMHLYQFAKDYGINTDEMLLQYAEVLLSGGIQDPNSKLYKLLMQHQNQIPALEQGQDNQQVAIINGQLNAQYAATLEFQQAENNSADENCDEELVVKDDVVFMNNQLILIIQTIKKKEQLVKLMENILLNKFSPYDYDKCSLVLKLIKDSKIPYNATIDVDKTIDLLKLFYRIVRKHPISSFETKLPCFKQGQLPGVKGSIHEGNIPKIVLQRLPLHPFMQATVESSVEKVRAIVDILQGECFEDSIEQVLCVAHMLNFNNDDCYLFMARNIMKNYEESKSKLQEMKNVQNDENLRELDSYERLIAALEKVKDNKKVLSTVSKFAKMLSIGTAKIKCYNWVADFLESWMTKIGDNEEHRRMLTSLRNSNLHFAKEAETEHVVSQHGLDYNKLFNVKWDGKKKTTNPIVQVLSDLYDHPSIVTRFYQPASYPDIHSLFDQLGTLHEKEFNRIRQAKIIRYIQDRNDKKIPQNQHFSEEEKQASIRKRKDENMIKLIYVLSYPFKDPNYGAKSLYHMFTMTSTSQMSNWDKVRAFECFLHISTDEAVVKLLTSGKSSAQMSNELKLLVYACELEDCGLKMSVEQLRNDCAQIVRVIVTSTKYKHNTRMLKIAARMFSDLFDENSIIMKSYSDDAQAREIWTLLLNQLVSCKQVDFLHNYLQLVCGMQIVKQLNCLPSVWQNCVSASLIELTPPINTSPAIEALLKCYNFLMKCPLLHKLNLHQVTQHLIKLSPALALGCLIMAKDQQENVNKLVAMKKAEIVEELEKFSKISPVKGQRLIMQAVEAHDES